MAYVGEYRERLRDGHGSYVFPGGSFRYEGQWKRGKMHGPGVFSLPDGSTYEGEFQYGEIDGIGLRRWPDGSTYNGQFRRGERHGEGVFIATNGEVYEGHWENNQRQSLGELRIANGDVYRGDFHCHKPHGNGKITFVVDGSVYDGDWVDGKICGRGTLKDVRGNQVYEGEWFNGKRCGHGVGTISASSTSSIVFDGIWTEDKPLAPTTKLALKLVVERTSTENGDPVTEMDIQDVPAVITLDKKVGLCLPPLAGVSLHESTSDSVPSIVRGEGGRRIRLRVFEGPIPVLSARDESDQTDAIPDPTPLQFIFAPDPTVDATSESNQEDAGIDSEYGGQVPALEEVRMDEVVVPNQVGVSVFGKLAMPSASLARTYHLLCDCVDNEEQFAPVYLAFQIVE